MAIWNTSDPAPRSREIPIHLPVGRIVARDDAYSDRIRCDHPEVSDGRSLGEGLVEAAAACGRGRVVALVDSNLATGLEDAGFVPEGRVPGFYDGEDDCHVMGGYPEPGRGKLAHPGDVDRVRALLEEQENEPPRRSPVETRLAELQDAEAIAGLLAHTFEQYPTPSGDPGYIERAIEDGIPFRLVEDGGDVVACASADLVRDAKTAELTDCATRPDGRGRGLMQAILLDLMADLRTMGYPTAFTLARARIPGMNLAFQRLGFELCGTMPRSCRIGDGIEDMNIWSRPLTLS